MFLTTYDIALLDQDFLSQIPWHFTVIDEAQRLKNPSSVCSNITNFRPDFDISRFFFLNKIIVTSLEISSHLLRHAYVHWIEFTIYFPNILHGYLFKISLMTEVRSLHILCFSKLTYPSSMSFTLWWTELKFAIRTSLQEGNYHLLFLKITVQLWNAYEKHKEVTGMISDLWYLKTVYGFCQDVQKDQCVNQTARIKDISVVVWFEISVSWFGEELDIMRSSGLKVDWYVIYENDNFLTGI